MNTKSLFMLFAFLAFYLNVLCQEQTLKQGETQKLARITTGTGEVFTVKNLYLHGNSIIYLRSGENKMESLVESDLSEIKKVEVPVGDMRKKGLITGGLVGAGLGAVPLMVREIQIAKEERENGYNVTGGEARYLMPVAGALVGLGIGVLAGKATKIYKTAYENKNTSYLRNLKLDAITMNTNQLIIPGFRLTMKF